MIRRYYSGSQLQAVSVIIACSDLINSSASHSTNGEFIAVKQFQKQVE